MTERGLTTDRFSSQSASAELIEWFALPKRETIVLVGLYSSAKAFAIASAAKKGIHTVLLNNREDANKRLWIGTQDNGLYKYNLNENKLEYCSLNDPKLSIKTIFQDKRECYADPVDGSTTKGDPVTFVDEFDFRYAMT